MMSARELVARVPLFANLSEDALARIVRQLRPRLTLPEELIVRKGERGESYQGGKWIEITYGRPILRQRANIFGSGADYGKTVNAGSPVWRAGANASTQLKTDVTLQIGGKTVPAGTYTMFIDLKENNWTLIVSSWPAQTKYDPDHKDALWGSDGYTRDKDVARVQMTVGKLPFSVDQLTWSFVDVTATGGRMAIMWDRVVATAPFTVANP